MPSCSPTATSFTANPSRSNNCARASNPPWVAPSGWKKPPPAPTPPPSPWWTDDHAMMTLDAPLTADELIAQANAALEQRDSATMRECLGAAFKLRPGDAELALALGHVKLHAGDYAEALADYTTVTRLVPRSAAAHAGRALALSLLG